MGIKNLFSILGANDYMGHSTQYPGASDYLGNPDISNCGVFIDFSVILYRYVLGSPDIETSYLNIRNMLKSLREKGNDIKIFLDPAFLKKKENVHKFRTQQKGREIKKLKTTINNSIQENLAANSNVEVNPDVVGVLELETNNTRLELESFENYKDNLNVLKNNQLVSIQTELPLTENNDLNVYSFLENTNTTIDLSLPESNFKLFVYLTPFHYHQRYILEKLFAEEIIFKSEVYQAENVDAEFALLQEYVRDDTEKIKVIISTDQDLVFFSLFNSSETFICISITTKTEDVKIVQKNNISKNLAFLTIFFNVSDYFTGVYNSAFTKEKVKALRKTTFFEQIADVENMKDLVKIYLETQNRTRYDRKEVMPDGYRDNIDDYFNQLELYKTLDPIFYEKPCIQKITITQLYNYFNL
ncbi:putative FEN1-like nuclease [Diachasmimorpha longicaudata entomopoxvirus]|uniref:Putative FEN1-like nuclease n=1 Tax=Diachasmimorpha longicaudata entomopoxvirus TaxID=109981 RepID=A0A7R5WF44_9POXV|nr:putative FEN1-like nuclease [Diachasmimorpha longicaudata entomopoxvirus]AKS26335.1 putative FEN1-like nuclease [Diachasmimorpha longicaudata entomopoxvirus]